MKILVAYDGSECADAALEDLKRAGLPAEAEVLVMSWPTSLYRRQSTKKSITLFRCI